MTGILAGTKALSRGCRARDRSRFAIDRDSRPIAARAASQNRASTPRSTADRDRRWIPPPSLSALLAIVVIDLVLAGDNAIVIALAARSLPAALQKRAIVWGAVGAIVVRSLMTVIVVWLLQIPGLLLAGGLLLLWIAYRLLLPDADGRRSARRRRRRPSGARCGRSSSPTR